MTNQQQQVQPIYIMPEDTKRSTGRSAQKNNILAGKLVAETVRTTLGPKGMDKMLVDSMNNVIVTNDGVTILEEMQIEHPAAKMIVEIARTQEKEVGDGTTTAVVIAGELLRKAEDLLDKDIHPTVIVKGYRMASEKAIKILNDMAIKLKDNDDEMLRNIAITAMTGKGAESSKDIFADLCVKAIKQISTKEKDGKILIDIDNIKIEKTVGGSGEESELVNGIIIDKERVHSAMPTEIRNARVALIDSPIEIKSTEIDAKIQITDPSQLQGFLDNEEKMLRTMVDKITKSGANVVFCQKGIDDMAQHFLAKKGVFACRRVKKSDLEKLAKATGAKIVNNFSDLSATDLGFAGLVEEKKVGDEDMTYVRDCKNPKAVTILIRGGTEHVIDEVKRAMDDAIGDLAAALKVGRILGGAGAPEMELARQLRKYSESLSGREQLAVNAFAESMEVIPRTLAENAGLDPIDTIAELRSAHDRGEIWAGLNVFTGKTMDSLKQGIIEPLKVKTQAISSASEVSTMILRIDDVIASGNGHSEQRGPPPGMGDMM